ncbi:MAG: hypothetical protein ACK518_04470 [bacterium]|jgi:hypothetical protein
MKTNTEILKSLNLPKNATNNKIASHYLNILKLVNEIKNDITAKEVINFEVIEPGYRQTSQNYHLVFDVDFLKILKLTTSFGCYHITAPTNTNFYAYLCVLLQIENVYTPEVENIEIVNTIYIDNSICESVLKAAKFIDLKNFLDLSKNIYLQFENDFVNVLSTNGSVLYKSQKFDFVSHVKIQNLTLCIPSESIDNFKASKNEFLKIDLIDSDSILINENKVFLAQIDSDKLNVFNFDVDQKMNFYKSTLEKNIKGLKGFLDYRKQLKFHLNGCIDIQTVNQYENSKTSIKLDYISKDFKDSDFVFKFDDITKVLNSFKTKELVFSPKVYNNKNLALITDNIDSILITSQI